jgi:hypothetical protein
MTTIRIAADDRNGTIRTLSFSPHPKKVVAQVANYSDKIPETRSYRPFGVAYDKRDACET